MAPMPSLPYPATASPALDFEVPAAEVLERVPQTQPDIILLDLEMPEMDGVAVLQRLRDEHPGVRTIIFTAFDSDERILSAVQAGAQGYLLKGAPREKVFNAVRVVHEGGSLLQLVVVSKLLKQMSEEQAPAEAQPEALTPVGSLR